MPKTVLVVDNDFFFVEFLAELLESRAYNVIKAYDGKEAISKIDDENIDLMFVDIVMPKIDGTELIKFVRMKYPENCFSIVAVSGTIIERIDTLSNIGADYYIAKGPMEKMAANINELLDNIDNNSFDKSQGAKIVESGNLFPRREAIDLLDSIQFHKAIIECVGFGIVNIDLDARIIGINSSALNILNKTTIELLNRPVTDIFPHEDRSKLINTIKNFIHNSESSEAVYTTIIDSKKIRVVVTLLTVEKKNIGLILALEDCDKWEEQA
ncbi:MAG: response regulator [Desulfobacterium sp.]|nr:response regulator [Desulfobacterium sp.]MBU3948267.1 response regulator [Pseudomonadota bacterium]